MRNGKRKLQRVWIKLEDHPEDSGTYQAKITFNPNIEGRAVEEDSPCLNAAVRLWSLLSEHKEEFGSKLPVENKIVTSDRFNA